jgi:acetoin utilization protein AcuB
MTHRTCITEIMTPNPIVVAPDATLSEISAVWKDHSIHHLPVVDYRGHLVGILSFTDFARASREIFHTPMEKMESTRLQKSVLVKDLMTDQHRMIALDTGASLTDAIRLFKANRFHALPVIEGKRLVGIVTVYDMILAFEQLLSTKRHEPLHADVEFPPMNFGF